MNKLTQLLPTKKTISIEFRAVCTPASNLSTADHWLATFFVSLLLKIDDIKSGWVEMQKTNTYEGRVREALKSLNYTKPTYGG